MEAIESLLTGLKSQIEAQTAKLEAQNSLLLAQASRLAKLDTEVSKIRHTLLSLKPLDTFDLFPKLPIEIRHKIWQLAIPGPSIVTLAFKIMCNPYTSVWVDRGERLKVPGSNSCLQHYREESPGVWIKEYGSAAFTKLIQEPSSVCPALLITCRESYSIASTAYASCMSTADVSNFNFRKRYASGQTGAIIPNGELIQRGFKFQPSCDTVFLTFDSEDLGGYFEFCDPTELETENIRSLAITWSVYEEVYARNLFSGLEELIIVDNGTCGRLDCKDTDCRGCVVQQCLKEGKKFTAATRQPRTLVMTEKQLRQYVSIKAHA